MKNSRLYIAAITILSLITSCSKSDNSDPDLIGNISRIRTTCYSAKENFGEIVADKTLEGHLAIYDSNKNPLEIKYYDKDGNLCRLEKFTYESSKLMSTQYYNADGTLQNKEDFKYSGDLLIESYCEDHVGNAIIKYNTVNTYNGENIDTSKRYENDTLATYVTYTLGDHTEKQVYYDNEDQIYLEVYIEYNKEKQIKKHFVSMPYLSPNNDDDIFCADLFSSDTVIISYNNNRLPETIQNCNLYQYPSMTPNEIFDSGNDDVSIRYEYDSIGNWIKKTIYKDIDGNLFPKNIVIREIEYK